MVFSLITSGLLPASAIIFIGCGMFFKKPSADLKDVKVQSISLSSLTLDVTVVVDNQNPAGIRIRSIRLDVFFQDEKDWVFLSHGEQQDFRIHAGKSEVTIPLTIRNAELLTAIIRMVATGKITLRVKGTVAPDFLIFTPEVPFCNTTTIPLTFP